MPYPLFIVGLRAAAQRRVLAIETMQAGSGLMGVSDVEILLAVLTDEANA